jgi:hypothetical protein
MIFGLRNYERGQFMKKVVAIFLIVFGLFVFNIVEASAGCNILWTGDLSGSVPTSETSRTPQAAQELSMVLFNDLQWQCELDLCICNFYWNTSDQCQISSIGCHRSGSGYSVCIDGSWDYKVCPDVFNPERCSTRLGTWDVICGNTTTTTTTIQQTTTTTAPATFINLSSFTATPKFSKVIIQWSTESEIDNAGFNLYRAESVDGEYEKINASLIPALGSSTQGSSYEFVDNDVQNRKTYYYKLEDIDINGVSTFHGPVTATPRLILGLGK